MFRPLRLLARVLPVLFLVAFATLFFFGERAAAENARVDGSSMEPTLHDGEYLIVDKAIYARVDDLKAYLPSVSGDSTGYLFLGPQRGDVIVFRYPKDPSRDFVKRVIGTPGDTVEIRGGAVIVNGRILQEDYLNGAALPTSSPPVAVPAGNYFVLGDNRNNSSDSRVWGFVPADNIIGKASISYWPLSSLRNLSGNDLDLDILGLKVNIPLP